jgi:hypothetical protein
MRVLVVALALCVLPLSGCITFAGDHLHDIETTAPGAPQPIEQTVSDFSFHGGRRTFDRLADNLYQQLASQGAFEGGTPCSGLPLRTAPP